MFTRSTRMRNVWGLVLVLVASASGAEQAASPRPASQPGARTCGAAATLARSGLAIPPGRHSVSGHYRTRGVLRQRQGRQGLGCGRAENDDSAWRELDLPHDWAVEGPFAEQENIAQGYRPRGIGWYRRQFQLDPAERGQHLELQFDGVATHCTVWVNGTVVHRNWCGYTSFYLDLTPLAQYGDKLNTIAVRVDANAMEGWWYEGAGLYRHTWLVKRHPVHLMTDGVYANPVRAADGSWSLPVEATLENSGRDPAAVEVEVTLADPSGQEVAHRNAGDGGCARSGRRQVGGAGRGAEALVAGLPVVVPGAHRRSSER